MGLKPGESDCDLCLLRLRHEGGNGLCPRRGAFRDITRARRDCTAFVEGDYVPKAERKLKQEEALF